MPKDLTPQKIASMLLRHVKLIVLISILATLIAYGYSKFFITPSYSASALILIQNYDEDATQATTSSYYGAKVNVSDISASATLASNCVVLFSNSPDMTALMSGASVTISQENDSNFIRISATASNPQLAANVANQLAEQAPVCFSQKFTYGKVDTVSSASAPSAPSAPNVNQNTMYGFFVGLIIGVLLAFFLEIIDTTIKPGDDLAKIYGIPVFAEIVDFEKEG
jgi:capsular polysaccharide biosynthesis protein